MIKKILISIFFLIFSSSILIADEIKKIVIDGNKRISLKKAGGSQLLSAGKMEAISTVEAAMRMYSIDPNGKKKVESLLDNLENNMIKLQSDDTITKLNKMREKSISNSFSSLRFCYNY